MLNIRCVSKKLGDNQVLDQVNLELKAGSITVKNSCGSTYGIYSSGGSADKGRVVLSGGVFQNMYLLPRILDALAAQGFEVYHHSRVSTNDEGIALGQLIAAAARRKEGFPCV